LLREQVENGTTLGKLAEPILARGEYLPDELMYQHIGDWLARQTDGWVLDGFPRSEPQARFLDAWLAERGLKLDVAISLEAPFNELLSRMRDRLECPECRWSGQIHQTTGDRQCPECGSLVEPRPDDSEENFTSRHQEFLRLTRPLIDYYRERNLLCSCDASAPRDAVTTQLLSRCIPAPVD
jgi:adenylate kinase